MKLRLNVNKEKLKFVSGIVFGAIGCAVFVASFLVLPKPKSSLNSSLPGFATGQAASPKYESQWLYQDVLRLKVQRRVTNPGGFSTPRPLDVGSLDVGPAKWQVRYCMNGTMPTGVGFLLSDCSAGSTRIDETWSVLEWAEPSNFNPEGSDRLNVVKEIVPGATAQSNVVGFNDGSCKDHGRIYRAGMYAVSYFATACDNMQAGSAWTYSVLPTKWHVKGTINP